MFIVRDKVLILVVLAVGVAAAAGPSALSRIVPESAPIARGAAYAAQHQCVDNFCRAERRGEVPVCREIESPPACEDISVYWQAMRLRHDIDKRLEHAPNNRLLAGERLARERNCFRCHGELGQGGLQNAGALKGYVPGYFGADFLALTANGRAQVVREWITTGNARVLTDSPMTGWIARFYLERQAISMPRFSSLPEREVDLLVDYVLALNRFGPLDAAGLARYAEATGTRMEQLASPLRAGLSAESS